MKKSIFSAIQYLLLLILGFILLFYAFEGQDFDQLFTDLKLANYWWVLASNLVVLVAHIIRAIRWKMLIAPLGRVPLVKNVFYAVMAGYLANLAFPRMGEISRCGIIHKTDQIPIDQLVGTVVLERLIDLLMLLLIIGMTIALQYQVITGFLYSHWQTAIISGYKIFPFGFAVALSIFLLFYVFLKNPHWPFVKKLCALLTGFCNGLSSIRRIKNKSAFIAYSVLIWFFYFLSTYLCLYALDTLSNLGLMAAMSILVFASLAMIVPVQGGIGAFHWIVAEGLAIYSIPRSDGLAYATIIHSSQTILVLFIGLISVIILMFHSSKKIRQ